MATGSASVVASQVEEPPLPGGRYPREYATVCFQASGASVASTTYSFQTSFGAAPSVWGGQPVGSITTSFAAPFTSSLTANDVVFTMQSNDGANASFKQNATFVFAE